MRYLAALTMGRDKILRVLGRDPTAGLAQAREWVKSDDPILVEDGKRVLDDMGGHDEEVRAAMLALKRAAERWPTSPKDAVVFSKQDSEWLSNQR